MLDALGEVARELEISVPRLALGLAASPEVTTSVIVGARNDEQLRDNLAASEVKTRRPARRLDRASALPPEYPGWMVTMQSRDRLEAIPPERRFAKS